MQNFSKPCSLLVQSKTLFSKCILLFAMVQVAPTFATKNTQECLSLAWFMLNPYYVSPKLVAHEKDHGFDIQSDNFLKVFGIALDDSFEQAQNRYQLAISTRVKKFVPGDIAFVDAFYRTAWLFLDSPEKLKNMQSDYHLETNRLQQSVLQALRQRAAQMEMAETEMRLAAEALENSRIEAQGIAEQEKTAKELRMIIIQEEYQRRNPPRAPGVSTRDLGGFGFHF